MTMYPYVFVSVLNSRVKDFNYQNTTIKNKMTSNGSRNIFVMGMTIAFFSANYHLIFLSVLR